MGMGVGDCGCVCGCVGVWMCGCVGVWVCGCMDMLVVVFVGVGVGMGVGMGVGVGGQLLFLSRSRFILSYLLTIKIPAFFRGVRPKYPAQA